MAHRFDAIYQEGPKWEIDRPQGFVARLHKAGQLSGLIADLGCGSGENAIFLRQQGYDVVAFDPSWEAVRRAAAKPQASAAWPFIQSDGLAPPIADGSVDTCVDSGVFHVFDDIERACYVEALHRLLRPGGTVHLVCFSDREPPGWGPRRVTRAELAQAFATGWREPEIVPDRYELNVDPGYAQAWRVRTERTGNQ